MNNDLCINWNINSNEIIDSASNIIKKSKENNDNLLKINITDQKSAAKFINILSDDMTEIQIFQSVCGFFQYVNPDPEIRKASLIADLNLINHTHNLNLNKDIYKQLLKIRKFVDNDLDSKYVDRLIKNYVRNGIELNDSKHELLLKIRHEISKLENAISNHFNNISNQTINLNINEIKGIPKSILNEFEKKDDTVSVILNKTNYNLLMKYVKDSNKRKLIESTYCQHFIPITDHLSKIIVLRDKQAKILGYDSHSDYKAEIQMTKKSENIKNFLIELLDKINSR